MPSFTIVAIPREDDPVWKISSEKIPHLTILSLGDNLANASRVADYLGHVAETSLHRFGLNVDHRGVLGSDEADVLFFGKDGTKCLVDARADLLKNRDVFTAYNTSQQFPTWTPHLTLGYPTSPAKPGDREYPISWVSFDRVALWIDDFEGPEFQLKDAELSDAAWSSLTENGLMHFGVKGMHWGQHKTNTSGSSGPSRADGPSRLHKALTKAEAKKSAHDANHKLYSGSLHEHEKNGHKSKLMQNVYGVNANTDKYSFKAIHGKTLEDAHSELSTELKNEVFRAKNGSARQQRKIDRIKAKMAKVKHGLELNDLDDFLMHIENDDDDVLTHFGIKGMHWGQHKAVVSRPDGVTKREETNNRHVHGKRGAQRINAKVAGGMDLKSARDAEFDRNAKQAKAATAAAFAAYGAIRIAPVVGKYTMMALRSAAAKKIAARGAAAARDAMMSGKAVPSYKTVNLIFDGAAGVWS